MSNEESLHQEHLGIEHSGDNPGRLAALARRSARALYTFAGIQAELDKNPYREAHHRRQAVLIHTPKTAGNSAAAIVYGLASRQLGGHTPARTFQQYSPALFQEYLVFATVRHPFDRLRSAFQYLKSGGMGSADRRWARRYLSDFATFGEFMRGLERPPVRERILRYTHFLPQTHYLCGPDNTVIVDQLVRAENFEADMRKVCQKLDVDFANTFLNVTSGSQISTERQDPLEVVCFSIYRDDYLTLNYEVRS